MTWFESNHLAERAVLRALAAGFALVLGLQGLAGYVALRSTRAIEVDTNEVAGEQLAMARLLGDVQAGQRALAEILNRLTPDSMAARDRERLVRDLDRADQALAEVAGAAANTPEAALWRELLASARRFSASVRLTVAMPSPLERDTLSSLAAQHEDVARVAQELLAATERRLGATERAIESESHGLAVNARLLLGASLVLATGCAVLTVVFARRSIRKIESQASELGRVSWHLLHTQESMARRFAHELHDELGQSLAAVKANLSAPRMEEWAARRADSLRQVDSAIANVRELSQLLHPVVLDDFGLDAGLRWLTEGFSQRTGIECEYHSGFRGRLDDESELHLFRIAQEALTNIARHSRATRVRIDLHEDAARIRLTIEDNGRGLPTSSPSSSSSLGIVGMRARARDMGATLTFEEPKTGGLRIVVDAPARALPSDDEEADDHDAEEAGAARR